MCLVCHAHFMVIRWRADLSSPHGYSAPLAEDSPCPMNSFGTFVDRQMTVYMCASAKLLFCSLTCLPLLECHTIMVTSLWWGRPQSRRCCLSTGRSRLRLLKFSVWKDRPLLVLQLRGLAFVIAGVSGIFCCKSSMQRQKEPSRNSVGPRISRPGPICLLCLSVCGLFLSCADIFLKC